MIKIYDVTPVMLRKRFYINIFVIILLISAVFITGCGGDRQSKSYQATSISGEIDCFSGFDTCKQAESDSGGDDKELFVKVYRIQPRSGELIVFPGIDISLIDDNKFVVDNIPVSEKNFVLRIEDNESRPVLEYFFGRINVNENRIVITPETDIESKLIRLMFRLLKGTENELNPWELEPSILRDFVTEDLFFSIGQNINDEDLLESIAPFMKESYMSWFDKLEEISSEEENMNFEEIFDSLESSKRVANKVDGNTEYLFDTEINKEIEKKGILGESLSGQSVLLVAERLALLSGTSCMAGLTPANQCPTIEDSQMIKNTGSILIRNMKKKWSDEDVQKRTAILKEGNEDHHPGYLRPLDIINGISGDKRISLDDFVDDDFSISEIRSGMANFRDYLLICKAGFTREEACMMTESIFRSSRKLHEALDNPVLRIKQIDALHRQFIETLEVNYRTLRSTLYRKYAYLNKNDFAKVEWAYRFIILVTTLFDVPVDLMITSDHDADGYPDNVEKVMGTDYKSELSFPSFEVAREYKAIVDRDDSDNDGYCDDYETMAGSPADKGEYVPQKGGSSFCSCTVSVCPETHDNSLSVVKGIVEYFDEPAGYLSVGAYDSYPLTARALKYSSRTDDDGMFELNIGKKGQYIIVAFIDKNGDLVPGDGELFGYYGENYPLMIRADGKNIELTESISVDSRIGNDRCGKGEYFNPVTGDCDSDCAGGMIYDELLDICVCEDSGYYYRQIDECVTECPLLMKENKIEFNCECIPNSEFNDDLKKCECMTGMHYEENADACVCDTGFYNEYAMKCVDVCPESFVVESDDRSCKCPEGTEFLVSSGKCFCKKGILNPINMRCVEKCPVGLADDNTGSMCICKGNKIFDSGKGVCRCKDGYEVDSSGRCIIVNEKDISHNERNKDSEIIINKLESSDNINKSDLLENNK